MAKQSGAEIALSANQLTILQAEAAGSNSAASGTLYHGYSLAQFLATVNAPETTPNPAPQGQVPVPTVAISDVVNLMSVGVKSTAYGALTGGQLTVANNYYTSAQHISGSGLTQMATNLASTWLNEYAGLGLLTAAQVNAILLMPDPTWQARVPVGAPTQRLFGLPLILIEAGDCAGLSFPLP